MLSECLIVRCHRCDNGVLSNLECIELHVRVPPPAPTGRCILFTLANRLPRLTNLTMHDSANMQRCSIDRLLQWEFWATVSRWGLLGKLHPTLKRQNGMRFPVEVSSGNCDPELPPGLGCNFPIEPLGETATRNLCPKRDMVFPRTETAARLPRQNDSFSFVACETTKECPKVPAQ